MLRMSRRSNETRVDCSTAFLVHGNFVCLIMRDYHSGRIIYVGKKHMNITVEGCATPNLTLEFYTPMKASLV